MPKAESFLCLVLLNMAETKVGLVPCGGGCCGLLHRDQTWALWHCHASCIHVRVTADSFVSVGILMAQWCRCEHYSALNGGAALRALDLRKYFASWDVCKTVFGRKVMYIQLCLLS